MPCIVLSFVIEVGVTTSRVPRAIACDLIFVGDAQRDVITRKNIVGVPALLIEVLSQPRIDRVRKRDLYARFGVPEYWVADPEADRVQVYLLSGGAYGKPSLYEPGERLEYSGLAGLAIDLTELFARE